MPNNFFNLSGEDWYHGKCVNVSKSMGKVIEQSKKEWICPKCRSAGTVSGDKKLNQSKLTKFFTKNAQNRTKSTVGNNESIQHAPQHSDIVKVENAAKDKAVNVSYIKIEVHF